MLIFNGDVNIYKILSFSKCYSVLYLQKGVNQNFSSVISKAYIIRNAFVPEELKYIN